MAKVWLLLKACLLGLAGWSFPRLLIAVGVPLDEWIVTVGRSVLSLTISRELAIWGATFFFALLFIALGSFWPRFFKAKPKTVTDGAVEEIALSFPNECNANHVESLFKRSRFPICKGNKIDRRISIHDFYIGVQNPALRKTLRNARVVVESVSGAGPGSVLHLSLLCERTGKEVVDIPPGGMDYFHFGNGHHGDDSGMFHPMIIEESAYDVLMNRIDRLAHVGFTIAGTGGRTMSLLRNNGFNLEVTAYADDVPPSSRVFVVNARERIEVLMQANTESGNNVAR